MLIGGGGSVGVIAARRSFFFNSRLGVVMRAVSDDQTASWSVGIRVERAIAVAWGLSAVVATMRRHAVGQHRRASTGSLSLLLIKALAIAILGGLDSIPGRPDCGR